VRQNQFYFARTIRLDIRGVIGQRTLNENARLGI
jgi:hypothetical protein